jgi:FAD/FMN-containing dehydrogenase
MDSYTFTGLDGGTVDIDSRRIEAFRKGLRGRIIGPDDPEFESARTLWNGMIDKRPGLIVRCRGAADVMACVKLAREFSVILSVRGGGHNVAGKALCDGCLVVDLTEMNSVRVDPVRRLVHIEGGATLGDVDRETYPLGLSTPMGVVTATGYAGLTLHGGVGWQMRKHGLAADNVVSMDLVTTDGNLVQASEEENPDLFWALRGGGGNFGVVTHFTSTLHPTPSEVLFSVTIFSLDEATAVLRFMREYMAEAPDELSVIGSFWAVPELDAIESRFHGQPALFLLSTFLGSPEQAGPVIAPLRTVRPTIADLTETKNWLDVQRFFDADYPVGWRYYWKSTMIHEFTDEIIETLKGHALSRPSRHTNIDLLYLGGQYGRVSPEATAFGNRSESIMINFESNWEEPGEDATNIEWTRRCLKEVEDLSQSRTYLNFAGMGEDGDKMVRASFGRNYDRLQAVKAKYDPDNLFRTNFNVRPGGGKPKG